MTPTNKYAFLPIGIAIGAGIGVALGNIGVGIGLGVAGALIFVGAVSKKNNPD